MTRLPAVVGLILAVGSLTASVEQSPEDDASKLARAEWTATGGQAWDSVRAVVLDGIMTEGGVPGRFKKIIDLRTGHSRTVQETGAMRALRGYDGVAWNSANGIVEPIDLPPLIEDARAQAFVDRAGWRQRDGYHVGGVETNGEDAVVRYSPTNGSAVTVSFDRTNHLVTRTVIAADDGPLTRTYSDWRRIGRLMFAFHQTETSNTGEVTTFEITRVRLERRLAMGALARPQRSPHGRLNPSGQQSLPFRYAGSHILVPATVNQTETQVIFDTGGANYFGPGAAKRFGLKASGGVNLSGPGESSTTGGWALAKKISIGAAELRDEVVIVGPLPWGEQPSQADSIPGSAGFEFLSEFRTTIDYPAHTISFARFTDARMSPTSGTTVPFYGDGHTIFVEAEVDGRRGFFRLDTGDGNMVTLFSGFAKSNNLYQQTGDAAIQGSVGGPVSVRRITVSSVKLGGAEFQNIPGRVSQTKAGTFASRSLAGNLGGGILRCFRVTFDYSTRHVTFEFDAERLRSCSASSSTLR